MQILLFFTRSLTNESGVRVISHGDSTLTSLLEMQKYTVVKSMSTIRNYEKT